MASAAEGDGRVRVTLLARQTQHRRILNQEALIDALRGRSDIILKLVCMSFCHLNPTECCINNLPYLYMFT